MFDNLYENVGSKIKNLAKWVFIVEAISAIIAGICLMCFASDIDDPMFIFGIVAIILGPCVAWVGSWILYAFGELAEDVHAIRCNPSINSIDKNIQLIAEPYAKREAEEKAKREAEERAKREAEERAKREAEAKAKREAEEKARREAEEKARREAEEKARREAEAIAKLEAEKRAKQTTQKKEKTLSEELEYALKFQTDDGMVSYLKELQDETVQNILKSPQHLIREQIKNLLEHM